MSTEQPASNNALSSSNLSDSTGAAQSGGGAAAARVTMDTQHQQHPPQGGEPGSNNEGVEEQLQSAQMRLSTLHANRATASSELEEEAKIFMETPSTPEQERRLRLIFHLVQTQIHTHSHNMESILQQKLAAIGEVQKLIGAPEDDTDLKTLTIALSKARTAEAEIRVIERGLVAMRELNGRGESCRRKPGAAPTGWKQAKEADDKERVVKRSRLPAAAVKEMRTWLDRHWDDPVPTHEEKAGFAVRHEITTKQVENWFINIRMREWRPAMRRALDHAEETGSYAEFSRLLQHTADGNVFKKFLEEREMGNNSSLVPPPSLQRFIGAEGFAAFVGDRSHKRSR